MFKSINPYNGEALFSRAFDTDQELLDKLALAQKAYDTWQHASFETKAKALLHIKEELALQQEQLAQTMSTEMGKTLAEAYSEIDKCADACEYFATQAPLQLNAYAAYLSQAPYKISIQPTGAILGVMPWNYPLWQVFRYVLPNLMLGNVCLLKHAPNVGLCATQLETLFAKHLTPQVFQHLWADVDQIELLVSHPIVTGTTLTGSNAAGASLASLSGKHLKKSVMELGGSDPFIVDKSFDKLEVAVDNAIKGRLQNSGQTCIASKRFLIHEDLYEDFKQLLLSKLEKVKVGNPLDPNTQMGPLARQDLREKLIKQIEQSIKEGAKALNKVEYHNNCINPVVLELSDINNVSFSEELFGPVFVLKSFNSPEEAIALANRTAYGLAASIWSLDPTFIDKAVSQIDAGNVFINELPRSDVRVPFGGTKMSGYGRELSILGLTEFANIKTANNLS